MIEVTMRTRQIRKRLARLEKSVGPKYDEYGTELISLEDLCRSLWKLDRKGFENTRYRHYASRFQDEEDAEVAENARRRLHTR